MKVLIIALDSQIRDALEAQLAIRHRAYQSVGLQWLQNVTDGKDAASALTLPKNIGVVVNAASLESLQQQPGNQALEALKQLVTVCEQSRIPLIQLSSSQVFDGIDSGRHRESEEVLTASPLGNQLVNMETLIQAECEQHIILRTGPIFSSSGDNLLTRLVPKFSQPDALQLSNNGKSCPLHAKDVARVVSAIIDQLSCGCESWGVYHYSSSEPASHYHFAEALLAVVSQYAEVNDETLKLEPIDKVDEEWRRPLLNCEKILSTFGIKQLPWRAFIVPTVKKLFNPSSPEADHE